MAGVAAEDPSARKGEAAPVQVAKRWYFLDLDSTCSGARPFREMICAHGPSLLDLARNIRQRPKEQVVNESHQTKVCISPKFLFAGALVLPLRAKGQTVVR